MKVTESPPPADALADADPSADADAEGAVDALGAVVAPELLLHADAIRPAAVTKAASRLDRYEINACPPLFRD
jgi:hypothetical protein